MVTYCFDENLTHYDNHTDYNITAFNESIGNYTYGNYTYDPHHDEHGA